jgi:hypothetical protein
MDILPYEENIDLGKVKLINYDVCLKGNQYPLFYLQVKYAFKSQACDGNESTSHPNKCHYIPCNIIIDHHSLLLAIL